MATVTPAVVPPEEEFLTCNVLRADANLCRVVNELSKVDLGIDTLKGRLANTAPDQKALKVLHKQKKRVLEQLRQDMIAQKIAYVPISDSHVLHLETKMKKRARQHLPKTFDQAIAQWLADHHVKSDVASFIDDFVAFCNETVEEEANVLMKRAMTNRIRVELGLSKRRRTGTTGTTIDVAHAEALSEAEEDEEDDDDQEDQDEDDDDEKKNWATA